jgi:amino-acid N-acetyltransferase
MNAVAKLAFRTPTAAESEGVRHLLERSGLPTGDLSTARPEFVIAIRDDQVIGIGALEHFGRAALLRSVAVEPQTRGSGIGRLIVEELERRARTAGISELILLTLTAQDFFARLGYSTKERDEVPPAVRESAQFRSLCPASAVCMAKTLMLA